MFKRIPDPVDQPLEDQIDFVIRTMSNIEPESEDYADLVSKLTKLYALKPEKRERVKIDTLVSAGASILGIVIIVGHEKAHIITSKAFGLIRKL